MFSLTSVEIPSVLLRCRSQVLKKHVFYCVFVRICWKTCCFIVCPLTKVENHWFYYVLAQKYWKTIGVIVLSLKQTNKTCLKLSCLLTKWKSALLFQRKNCRIYKCLLKCWLLWKSLNENETAPAAAGLLVSSARSRVVCVFLCIPLFDFIIRDPLLTGTGGHLKIYKT